MKIFITGGVGFIGTNTACYFAEQGHELFLLDNFFRHGVDDNAQYLQETYPDKITILQHDVADTDKYLTELKKAELIIHLAGQTAVTTSITDPQFDFHNNLVNGFNFLETVRQHNPEATLIYSSTNKVYGDLADHKLKKNEAKQQYLNLDYPQGIDEAISLDFVSPYGCSKGSVDQYFLDYARIYDMNTVVFRQSCIYGPFQMGVEDQGWVAHFSKQFLLNQPITIYGDGYQVRDLLFVGDLVQAYEKAHQQIKQVKGQVFNIGGGIDNAHSLLNVLELLKKKTGHEIKIDFDQTRSGDQLYFVSANQKLKDVLGWEVQTAFADGLEELLGWQRKYFGEAEE